MTDLGGGLGLERRALRLQPSFDEWLTIGGNLASALSVALGSLAVEVQHVGSTSVPGLVAKPIIDLVIGAASADAIPEIGALLGEHLWIYHGDAGDDGGHLYMLESEPDVRVAHAHVVVHGDLQWQRYLRFRDYLRASADARDSYAAAKLALVGELGAMGARPAYTERKTPIIAALLDEASDV